MGFSKTVAKKRMIDALLTKTQQRVYGLIFGQPDRKFWAKEIIELAQVGTGAVQRELEKLVDVGLVIVEMQGRTRFYKANRNAPVFEELRSIVLKTVGLVEPIGRALEALSSKIDFAFVFGSIAKGEERVSSDIDLFVVSDSVDFEALYEALIPVEATLARKVNVSLYNKSDFKLKQRSKDSFVQKVLAGPILPIVGDLSGFNRDKKVRGRRESA